MILNCEVDITVVFVVLPLIYADLNKTVLYYCKVRHPDISPLGGKCALTS